MRRAGVLAVLLAVVASAATASAQPAPPELTAPVNDFAGVIDPAAEQQLEALIRQLQNATSDVMVVATVKTFKPWADLPSYAVKMFENGGKGIGQKGKDNGVLIVLAVDDRQVRVEVGLRPRRLRHRRLCRRNQPRSHGAVLSQRAITGRACWPARRASRSASPRGATWTSPRARGAAPIAPEYRTCAFRPAPGSSC